MNPGPYVTAMTGIEPVVSSSTLDQIHPCSPFVATAINPNIPIGAAKAR
jgi:hypothetical protein